MRESLRFRGKDVLQRVALVAILFVVAYIGVFLGVQGRPNILGLLVAVLGACTLLWVLDPALQHLYDTAEDEEEETDGDVA